jgi:hypothetical protein
MWKWIRELLSIRYCDQSSRAYSDSQETCRSWQDTLPSFLVRWRASESTHKMSSFSVVLRELLQNADDAEAKHAFIRFESQSFVSGTGDSKALDLEVPVCGSFVACL